MPEIPLEQGQVALVDQEDYDKYGHLPWFYSKTGYAVGYIPLKGRFGLVYLHRVIMKPGQGQHVDHINGNPLDNRRENLRFATPQQNVQNKRVSSLSQTKLKGVGWHRDRQKYHARIQLRGIRVHLDFFDNAETAALTYDAAARTLFGTFALCNYPERKTPRSVAIHVHQRLKRRGLLAEIPEQNCVELK